MAISGYKHVKSWRLLKRRQEAHTVLDGPRMPHDASMCDDTEKLIADAPREVPGPVAPTPPLDERAAPRMLRRALIGRVYQHVRVDQEH
jgi:hypothetical protein